MSLFNNKYYRKKYILVFVLLISFFVDVVPHKIETPLDPPQENLLIHGTVRPISGSIFGLLSVGSMVIETSVPKAEPMSTPSLDRKGDSHYEIKSDKSNLDK